MKHQLLRRLSALVVSLITLWTSLFCADATAFGENASSELAISLLRWELGDFFGSDLLSDANVLALLQSPLLLQQRATIVSRMGQQETKPDVPVNNTEPAPQTPLVGLSPEISFDGDRKSVV